LPALLENLSFDRWKHPEIVDALDSVLHKAAQVWRAQRVCSKNRTRTRARHLANLNTKGLYTEMSGGVVDRDGKVTELVTEVSIVCVYANKFYLGAPPAAPTQ
jgi:hypothetical protein